MKTNEELREIALASKQVLFPNRYYQIFIEAFQEMTGIEVPEQVGRKSTIRSNGLIFRWVGGRDIPRLVELTLLLPYKVRTIGFTGSEWCLEYAASLEESRVEWSKAKLKKMGSIALIAPPRYWLAPLTSKERETEAPFNVVTAYPNYVNALRKQRVLNAFPEVALNGGVEAVSDMLQMPAIDLVSTGDTVADNKFQLVRDITDVFPAMVYEKQEIESVNSSCAA